MPSRIKNWLIRMIPREFRSVLDNLSVSRKFRRFFRAWVKKPQRLVGFEAQTVLRESFVRNGMSDLDWAHRRLQHMSPFISSNSALLYGGIGLSEQQVNTAVDQLREHGFWVSPIQLSADWVKSVLSSLETLDVEGKGCPSDVQIPREIRPTRATYWHKASDLEDVKLLCDLIRDPGVVEIIGRYLKCRPVFDFPAAWWSFPSEADAASAQMFHFDLDRIRWLKVFVYLTDVEVVNGPHVYVRGSHQVVGDRVKRDGRFSDAEALEIFPELEFCELTGAAGTLFVEDTLGFHKGTPVISGHRCVFEYEYSIGHFGYPYPPSKFDCR